jgi:hypothetical protein
MGPEDQDPASTSWVEHSFRSTVFDDLVITNLVLPRDNPIPGKMAGPNVAKW